MWNVFRLLLANLLVYGVICGAARVTGDFHLRLVCEGLAAGNLVLVTVAGCLLRVPSFVWRWLVVAVTSLGVIGGCGLVLGAGFAAWMESAIWFVPVTITCCLPIWFAGQGIAPSRSKSMPTTFSIATLMMATTMVACLFPLVRWLSAARADAQLHPILWITDPLVLVVPIAAIGVGLVATVLSNKPFHAAILIVAAPILGFLTARIYGWNHYQSMMIPATVSALLIATLSWLGSRQSMKLGSRHALVSAESHPVTSP